MKRAIIECAIGFIGIGLIICGVAINSVGTTGIGMLVFGLYMLRIDPPKAPGAIDEDKRK